MIGQPREKFALHRVGGEVTDQGAFGGVGAQLLQVNFHVLRGAASPAEPRLPARNIIPPNLTPRDKSRAREQWVLFAIQQPHIGAAPVQLAL